MRRFLTLVCLLVLAVPAGVTISGCTRNPAGNYCNGEGNGPKITDLYTITLGPQFTGISLAYGQTRQSNAPSAATCKTTSYSVSSYTYGTTNNQLVDITPSGNMCAGTWNRNSGGGIADYTICSPPNPLPSTNGLPYGVAYITASADGVTSNPVPVYIHPAVTSISLVGPGECLSQNQEAQLDAQACYAGTDANGKSTQVLLCAPSTVTSQNYACPLPKGVNSVPACENSIGTMTFSVGTGTVATIDAETNEITAQLPGTTVITASIAQSASSAGYFSTCPPQTISVSLNGNDSGVVTQGVQQNLVTTVTDTKGATITGLTLDYQSTNPVNLSVSSVGAITASFAGAADVYAICQPGTCNPSPINQVGVQGTGLPIASNPVSITVPGTATTYAWFAAPGKSQYFSPYDLQTGTPSGTVRLPYVPNSVVMDRLGTNLYFGSQTELMVYNSTSNGITGQYPGVPGVVLAVSPNNQTVLVNDPIRQAFYLVTAGSGSVSSTFGGLGVAAQWTPDSKTLYIVDSAAANSLPENIAAGTTNHTDTLYVYNANTGFTSYPLTSTPSTNPNNIAITVPGVGAYIGGATTVAHTWCPTGTPTDYSSMVFYPQGDSVAATADALAATTDGQHILGATLGSGNISFSDIAVTIPPGDCPAADTTTGALSALTLTHTLNQANVTANATAINQVVTSPAAVTSGSTGSASSLSFITYTGSTTGATLPWYKQTVAPNNTAIGTVGYVTLTGAAQITAPIAGAFSPDNSIFFVSTSGDNKVHYIDTTTLTDTQQVTPGLPACTPLAAGGSDQGCKYTGTDTVVPVTVITVKPRATT